MRLNKREKEILLFALENDGGFKTFHGNDSWEYLLSLTKNGFLKRTGSPWEINIFTLTDDGKKQLNATKKGGF